MTIDKAIEILHDHVYHPEHHHDLDTQNAMLLGIEALKQIEEWRRRFSILPHLPLPGETKD